MVEIPVAVSFGLSIKESKKLQTLTTGEVLEGIRTGQWRELIISLRAMTPDSAEQKAAKNKLPYVTWSGVFQRRAKDGLIVHSGQIGIDLDGLTSADCAKAVQNAREDSFCLAAYKSAGGRGMRLLFRIPPCDAHSHDAAFEQVAEHVRETYGHEPDSSGRDVSRASYVSFDEGLWCNPDAKVLPVVVDMSHSEKPVAYRCVSSPLYAGELAVTAWSQLGRLHVGYSEKADGTVYTHKPLLRLGLAIALHAERLNYKLTPRDYEEATRAWYHEHQKLGLRLRGSFEEYRRELILKAEAARKKRWFHAAAHKWLRWTKLPDFPDPPAERLMFAIRRHCAEEGKNKFFIGCRDAGLVLDASYKTGHRYLQSLCKDGKIRLLTVPEERIPRQAFEYELIDNCQIPVQSQPPTEIGGNFSQN